MNPDRRLLIGCAMYKILPNDEIVSVQTIFVAKMLKYLPDHADSSGLIQNPSFLTGSFERNAGIIFDAAPSDIPI